MSRLKDEGVEFRRDSSTLVVNSHFQLRQTAHCTTPDNTTTLPFGRLLWCVPAACTLPLPHAREVQGDGGLERTGGGSETFSCSLQARCWSGCTCKSPLFCREGGGVADPLKAGPQTQAKVGDLEAEGNAIFIGCSYPGLARAIGVASLVADKSSHNGGGRVQGTKGWLGEEGESNV